MPGLFKRQRWGSKQYYVYGLVDPRDNLVRYIGITTDIKLRHQQHARSGNNRYIWRWARELENLRMSPVMQVLETINREAGISDDTFRAVVSEREASWIGEYLRLGTPLFNTFGVTRRYPHSPKEESSSATKLSTTSQKRQERPERVREGLYPVKGLMRDGYLTIDEIAELLGINVAKLRTMIARLDIQPRRFPDDMRKLYYSHEDFERIKEALGLK